MPKRRSLREKKPIPMEPILAVENEEEYFPEDIEDEPLEKENVKEAGENSSTPPHEEEEKSDSDDDD